MEVKQQTFKNIYKGIIRGKIVQYKTTENEELRSINLETNGLSLALNKYSNDNYRIAIE